MRLYDTAVGEVVEFTPADLVTMYVCGITPYDATHLGHAATYVTYDVLQRRLLDLGHEVRYVRNITDVDDDLLRAADERGVHYLDLAFGQTKQFDDDMAALNALRPWSEPRHRRDSEHSRHHRHPAYPGCRLRQRRGRLFRHRCGRRLRLAVSAR